jgi:hypothetical protein
VGADIVPARLSAVSEGLLRRKRHLAVVDNRFSFGHIERSTILEAKREDRAFSHPTIKLELHRMFWLKLIEVIVILTVGIFVIAFLEDTFVSAPRRRMLKRKAAEKLSGGKTLD